MVASDNTGKATGTSVCSSTLPTHTHRAVQHVLFRVRQNLETRGQIIKMASSSESSDEGDNLVVFGAGVDVAVLESEEREEQFGFELALNYCTR